MKTVDRQKICPNCDGKVAYDTTQCPYCFATLKVENPPSPKESFSALYSPPSSSTAAKSSDTTVPFYQEKSPTSEAGSAQNFWPLAALLFGGNLLTLSLLQFFFSDHGIIRLEMNGNYWFLILLVSLPLCYLGWKNLAKD